MLHHLHRHRHIFLAAFLLTCAMSLRAADDCANQASYALQQIADGQSYNLNLFLTRCENDPNAYLGEPFSRHGRSSKNIPAAAHAVLYREVCKGNPHDAIDQLGLPSDCDFYKQWFEDYFDDQKQNGLMDTEVFSPIYLNPIVASSLVVYEGANDHNQTVLAEKARLWLRSFWALATLMAVPGDINEEIVTGYDSQQDQGGATWAGITVAHAGTRPLRGWPPMPLYQSNLHHMLALALDYKGVNGQRTIHKSGLNDPLGATANTGLATMVQLSPNLGFDGSGRITAYGAFTPAEVFGLTQSERAAMTALIQNPDGNNLDAVLAMVKHPIYQCTMSILRTGGGIAVWLGGFSQESRGFLCNPDSGGFLASVYHGATDRAEVLAPAHAPHNRKFWEIYRNNDHLCADSEGKVRCISIPSGPQRYALIWDEHGIRRADTTTTITDPGNCTSEKGSELVSFQIPDEVICGESVQATVTMRNKGSNPWHTNHTQSPSYNIRVDSGAELMNTGFADFPDVEVGCNETYTFSFTIEPDLGGQSRFVNFGGSMVEETPGGQDTRDNPDPPSDPDPFGARFDKEIYVNCKAPYAARLVTAQTSGPDVFACGVPGHFSVTYENIGSKEWLPSDGIRIGTPGTENQGLPFPELRRSGLTHEVKPGETYTFEFDVNPRDLGDGDSAHSRWRLINESTPQWFGEIYENLANVSCAPPPPDIECTVLDSVAQDDSFEVFYETATILDVLANDLSPSGHPIFIGTQIQNQCGGQVSVEGGGQWIAFQPPLDTLGHCTITYPLTDETGQFIDQATAHIEINPITPPGPQIITQPADISAPLGGSASFSIAVNGFQGTPRYQWFHNHTPVGSDQPTLTLANLQPTDLGTVSCSIYGGSIFEFLLSRQARLTVTPVATQQAPYITHSLGAVPLVIQAEHFDVGGPDVAYHDRTIENLGNDHLRLDELASVDLATIATGAVVGWNQSGEWLEYTLSVASHKTVQLTTKMASVADLSDAPKISVYFNDQKVADQVSLQPTGAWSNFQTRQVFNGKSIPAGTVVMRVKIDQGPLNLDQFTLSENTSLAITQHPDSLTLAQGQTATMTVSAIGGQLPYTYSWTKNGQAIQANPRISGLGTATLSLTNLEQADAGDYRATVVDAQGNSRQTQIAILRIQSQTQDQSPFDGIATAVPGVTFAWQYDEGGPGISHLDHSAGDNLGDQERIGDHADITVNRAAGPRVIADFENGEWLEYTVFAPQTQLVDFWVTTSAIQGGQLQIFLDGQSFGSLAVPNAAGPDLWEIVKLTNLQMTQGTHILQIKSTGQPLSIDRWGTVPAGAPLQMPHPNHPTLLSGSRIQAEFFDLGGREIAYRDQTAVNDCQGPLNLCRQDDDVNIGTHPNGEAFITRTQAGEWLEYTLALSEPATLDLEFRVSGADGGAFTLEDNAGNVLQSQSFTKPNATSLTYSVFARGLNLVPNHGFVTLRFRIDQGNFNFYWFRYDQPDLAPFSGTAISLPTPAQSYIEAEHFDVRLDGPAEGLTYYDTTPGNASQSACGSTPDCHPGESVDIGHWPQSGIKFIEHIETGEWLAYTVTSTQSGPFVAKYAVAGAGEIYLTDAFGTEIAGSRVSFNTGSLTAFEQKTSQHIQLPIAAGETQIRVAFVRSGQIGIFFNRFQILTPEPEPPEDPMAVNDIRLFSAALVDPGSGSNNAGIYEFDIHLLFQNDTPRAPEAALFRIVRQPHSSQGSLEITADGQRLRFSKSSIYNGDSFDFDYRMTAYGKLSGIATAEVLLDTTGLTPFAADDGPFFLNPGQPIELFKHNLMINDEKKIWHDFTQPSRGTLVEDGFKLIYTPNANFTSGEDSFTYRSKVSADAAFYSNPATVTLKIGSAQTVLADDIIEMPYAAKKITQSLSSPAYMRVLSRDLTINDEPVGMSLRAYVPTTNTLGSLADDPGTPNVGIAFLYQRPQGLGQHAIAEDSFQYTAAPAGFSDPPLNAGATVTVRIFPSPIAKNKTLDLKVVQGETLTIPASAITFGDESFGRGLSLFEVRPGSAGTPSLLTDGSVELVAPTDASGNLTFQYRLTNDFYRATHNPHWEPLSNWADITVQVIPPPPTLQDDGPFDVVFGGIARFGVGDLSSNDQLFAPVTFGNCSDAQTQHGTLTCGPELIEYRPNPGYFGPDSFTYTLSDIHGSVSMNEATVTLHVLEPTVAVVGDRIDLPPTHFDHYDLPSSLLTLNDTPQGEIELSTLLSSDHFLAHLNGERILLTPDLRFFEIGKGFLDYVGHHILTDAITEEARAEIFISDPEQTLFEDAFEDPNFPLWSTKFETIAGAVLPLAGSLTLDVNVNPEDGFHFNEDLETLGHNAYLKGRLPKPEDHLWISFELDTSGVQIQEGHLLTIFRAGFLKGSLVLRQIGNHMEIAFAGNDTQSSPYGWNFVRLPQEQTHISLEWFAAKPGQSDGGFRLWLDGTLADYASQEATDSQVIDRFDLGVIASLLEGQQSGAIAFRNLVIARGSNNDDTFFQQSFDQNLLSPWAFTQQGSGFIGVENGRLVAHVADASSGTQLFATRPFGEDESHVFYSLRLHLNTFQTQNNNLFFPVFQSVGRHGNAFSLYLRKVNGVSEIALVARLDSGTNTGWQWQPLPWQEGQLVIETKAADLSEANGHMRLWQDGFLVTDIEGLANSRATADKIRLGALWGFQAGQQSGTVEIDDVSAWSGSENRLYRIREDFSASTLASHWLVVENGLTTQHQNSFQVPLDGTANDAHGYLFTAKMDASRKFQLGFDLDLSTVNPPSHRAMAISQASAPSEKAFFQIRLRASDQPGMVRVRIVGDINDGPRQYGPWGTISQSAHRFGVIAHAATQGDDGSLKLYVDGELVSEVSQLSNGQLHARNLFLGAVWGFGDQTQSGTMIFDHVFVWDEDSLSRAIRTDRFNNSNIDAPWVKSNQNPAISESNGKLRFDMNTATASGLLFVQDDSPLNAEAYRADFEIDLRSFQTTQSTLHFPIFQLVGDDGVALGMLYLRRDASGLAIAAVARNADGANTGWQYGALPHEGPLHLRVTWDRLSQTVQVYHQGHLLSSATATGRETSLLNRVRMGPLWGFTAGAQSGEILFDNFVMWPKGGQQ